MSDVLHAKLVIINTLVDLRKNQADGLKSLLANLFTNPIIVFNSAYSDFISGVAANSQTYNDWINLQAQIYTDLGEDRENLVKEACALFVKILKGTPGGDTGDFEILEELSFRIALLIRVYSGDIKFNATDLTAAVEK